MARRNGPIGASCPTPDAVDLSRAAHRLPLPFNHGRGVPISVVESVRLDARRLVGVLRFGPSARASEVWQGVLGGKQKNGSISHTEAQRRPGSSVLSPPLRPLAARS